MHRVLVCLLVAGVMTIRAAPISGQAPAATATATPPLPSITLPPALDRVLRDYERAWRARNADSLAALFTQDGFTLSSKTHATRACRHPGRVREQRRAARAPRGRVRGGRHRGVHHRRVRARERRSGYRKVRARPPAHVRRAVADRRRHGQWQRSATSLGCQNCAASVDPASATVDALPPDTSCVTASKYPVPTSRWWRVAV